MIGYLDTSVMVKRYVRERGSKEILRLCDSLEVIVISSVGYAEVVSAFCRKLREGAMTAGVCDRLIREFNDDWRSFARMIVSDQLNELTAELLRKHRLRGLDAIHLASALKAHPAGGEDFIFATADARLLRAARSEGLSTFPET